MRLAPHFRARIFSAARASVGPPTWPLEQTNYQHVHVANPLPLML